MANYTVIATNANEDVQNKIRINNFFRERAKQVGLNLQGQAAKKEMTPEERMKYLAIEVYRTSSQDVTYASLLQGLESKKERYKSEPSEDLKREIEEEEKMLRIFEEAIKDMKSFDTVKKEEENRIKEKAKAEIEEKAKIISKLRKDFIDYISQLKEYLKEEKYGEISVLYKILEGLKNNYVSLRSKFEAKSMEYIGKFQEECGITAPNLKLSDEEVKELYELTARMKIKLTDAEQIEKCDKLIDLYKTYLENPKEFDKLKAEIDEKIKNEQLESKNHLKAEITEKLIKFSKDMAKEYVKTLKEYKSPQNFGDDVHNKVLDILEKYKGLTDEEIAEFHKFAIAEIDREIEAQMPLYLGSILYRVGKINDKINELEKLEYNTEQFNKLHSEIIEEINGLEKLEEVTKNNVKVIFDKDNQKLHILYNSDLVEDYSRCIVKEEVLAKMNPKKQPEATVETEKHTTSTVEKTGTASTEGQATGETAGTPPEETTQPEEKKDELEEERNNAIQQYIYILEEMNEQYNYINECNSKINMLSSQIDFNNIDITVINALSDTEKIARQHDINIMQNKLDLSNARSELRRKYRCYVTSIKEVVEFKMSKVEFGQDYDSFIKEHDRSIVEAENTIEKMYEEVKNEDTSPERKAELSEKIKGLLNYIETMNSYIGRKIVQESTEKNIDMLSMLKDRREHKKELREEIRKNLSQPSTEPSQNAETIDDLENKLKAIYQTWLEAIKNGQEVDEGKIVTEIFETINSSTLPEKDKVAENTRRNFINEKERILTSKVAELLDTLTTEMNDVEINEKFANTIDAKVAEIKKYGEKTFETFGVISSLENNTIKVIINAQPPHNTGKSIERPLLSETKYNEYKAYIDKKNMVTPEEIKRVAGILYGINNGNMTTTINVLEQNNVCTSEKFNIIFEILRESGIVVLNEDGTYSVQGTNYTEYIKKFEKPAKEETITTEQQPVEGKVVREELKVGTKASSINREESRIALLDGLSLSLLKNSLKIRYSETLKERLKNLQARLSLVKKGTRSRTSIEFDENAEEQIIAPKNVGEELNPEEYQLQIRSRILDENGNPTNRTRLEVFTDITPEAIEELENRRLGR